VGELDTSPFQKIDCENRQFGQRLKIAFKMPPSRPVKSDTQGRMGKIQSLLFRQKTVIPKPEHFRKMNDIECRLPSQPLIDSITLCFWLDPFDSLKGTRRERNDAYAFFRIATLPLLEITNEMLRRRREEDGHFMARPGQGLG